MTVQSLSSSHLKSILETQYQLRSSLEHQLLIDIFMSTLHPQITMNQAKLYSFFASPLQQSQKPRPKSLILTKKQKSQFVIVSKLDHSNQNDMVIVVDVKDKIKCEAFQGRSPQTEVKFFQGCTLLNEIPKKRLFPILRHSKIIKLRYGQDLYQQGQTMENCYYLVRSGQFTFRHKDSIKSPTVEVLNKVTQLLAFKTGYLFQHEVQKQLSDNLDDFLSSRILEESKFNYTVRCKSSKGSVYAIDSHFFQIYLMKFCSQKIRNHLDNQLNFLAKKVKESSFRNTLSTASSQQTRSASLLTLTAPLISSARRNPKKNEQKKILDIEQMITDYQTLKDSMPRRDRLFSKQQMRKLFPDPEKDQSDALIWRKAKCDKLKQLTKPLHRPPSKGEILFAFTQTTIKFEKHRKKLSLL